MNGVDFLPPRAALHPLIPIGLRTDRVESLTSYLTRLAAVNFVSVNKLICKLILPRTSGSMKPQERCTFNKDLHLVNGMGKTALGWSAALNELTGRNDLAQLTFLPWTNILPTKHALVHRHRRWCPYCLDEMLQFGTTIYEPLIWTVEIVSLCPWHLTKLETHCPICGHHERRQLSGRRLVGLCSRCFAWFGKPHSGPAADASKTRDNYDIWVAKGFSRLLNRLPPLRDSVDDKSFAKMIFAGIQLRCNGVSAIFKTKIRRKKSTITHWRQGAVLPSVQSLTEISYVFRVPFDCLVYADQDAWKYAATERALPTTRQPKRHRYDHDWERNRLFLEEIVNGGHQSFLSLRAVASSLNMERRYLRRQFPELARKVSAECQRRRKAHLEREGQEKAKVLFEAAFEAAHALQMAGTYPSRKKIVAALRLRGIIVHRTHSPLIRNVQKHLAAATENLKLKGN